MHHITAPDPDAPAANNLVPSVNVIVVNGEASILMIRRTDNGNWAVPGGAVDLGESVAQAADAEQRVERGPLGADLRNLRLHDGPVDAHPH